MENPKSLLAVAIFALTFTHWRVAEWHKSNAVDDRRLSTDRRRSLISQPTLAVSGDSVRPGGGASATAPVVVSFESWAAYDAVASASAAAATAVGGGVAVTIPRVADAVLPLFLVVGAQKAGTTYLRMMLTRHPQLDSGRGFKVWLVAIIRGRRSQRASEVLARGIDRGCATARSISGTTARC